MGTILQSVVAGVELVGKVAGRVVHGEAPKAKHQRWAVLRDIAS